MKKLKYLIMTLCVLAVFFLGGCGAREEARVVSAEENGETDSAMEDSFSGRAEAYDTVAIVSKQIGKVAEVNVDIGSEVEKGQVLLRLDARELTANVDAARANLSTAEIAYAAALENESRAKTLYENGAIGAADYENNFLNVLKKAGAAVDLARANLDKAVIAREDCSLTAPIKGTVTEVNAVPGEMASSQKPCVVLINLDEMNIKLYVNEKKINALKIGQNYKVAFTAIPDQAFEGKISSISGAMDAASKGYLVNVTVENPSHEIKDGMFARVYL